MTIIDGVGLRDRMLEEYENIIQTENLKIRLDIITVGDDMASEVYVKNKVKYAGGCGIEVVRHKLAADVKTEELEELIDTLNAEACVTGIILQSPIPKHLDFDFLSGKIDYRKDVDGFTKENVYRMYQGRECLMPCTVKGIMKLLEHYDIDLKGKNVCVVGRGAIVGKPLAVALTNADATVTLCHSKTCDLASHTKVADIIVCAVGKKGLITADMVKEGFIGIDVGINRENGKLYGDFDYENVVSKASYMTPVPGGVGPMTIAMIIDNLIKAKKKQI